MPSIRHAATAEVDHRASQPGEGEGHRRRPAAAPSGSARSGVTVQGDAPTDCPVCARRPVLLSSEEEAPRRGRRRRPLVAPACCRPARSPVESLRRPPRGLPRAGGPEGGCERGYIFGVGREAPFNLTGHDGTVVSLSSPAVIGISSSSSSVRAPPASTIPARPRRRRGPVGRPRPGAGDRRVPGGLRHLAERVGPCPLPSPHRRCVTRLYGAWDKDRATAPRWRTSPTGRKIVWAQNGAALLPSVAELEAVRAL
jgi:hypothetical protein